MSVDAHTCSCCATADAAQTPAGASRRTVLRASAGVLAGGAALSLSACGSDDDGGATTGGGATTPADSGATTPADGGSGAEALTPAADVPVGGAVAVADGAIIVAQPAAGQFVAYDSKCPHQGCKVAPQGAELVCPCHASKFDLATGERLEGPATTGLTAVTVTQDGDDIVRS